MALAFWYGGTLLARREISAYAYFVIYISIVAGGEAAGEFFASSNSKFSYA
jgi:ATP-binding cassette subfamily B (MDR/TAP) protein 1